MSGLLLTLALEDERLEHRRIGRISTVDAVRELEVAAQDRLERESLRAEEKRLREESEERARQKREASPF
jgi:hypothetical protein